MQRAEADARMIVAQKSGLQGPLYMHETFLNDQPTRYPPMEIFNGDSPIVSRGVGGFGYERGVEGGEDMQNMKVKSERTSPSSGEGDF